MKAMINMNNGTTVTLDGTSEEISECYIQMLQGIIELNEWYHEEHGVPDTGDEQSQEEPEQDDTVDQLLDYISRTRGVRADEVMDDLNKNGGNQT